MISNVGLISICGGAVMSNMGSYHDKCEKVHH